MKIAWFCIPAHGHTNPTLGLVKELTNAGHEIFYFSFEQFRENIGKSAPIYRNRMPAHMQKRIPEIFR